MATRAAYGKTLAKLVQENENIVVLDADLAGSTKTGDAKAVCPERHFDMGIAEGNMMTVAASLGVDSCPIEGFKRTEVERILQEEGILEPQHFGVAVMATFGYRAEAPHRPKTRQSLGEITTWVR